MSDLISRQAAIKDAESWVAVDEYEKHLQKNVVEWLKEFPSAEHGTNLAEVGTDCISRQQAIDELIKMLSDCFYADEEVLDAVETTLKELPSALGTNLAEVGTDLISRAEAQTELQLSARRYTVAHEAHGEGRVVWSEDLISVSDAMDVLRKLPPAQPTFDARDTQYNLPIGTGLISRAQAIDAVDSETVSTNPEHFKSSEKFIKFMDDADISSFGIWQWSNGFNTALVATTIQLKKLPSAQPEQTEMIKEIRKWINSANRGNADYFIVDKIEEIINRYE